MKNGFLGVHNVVVTGAQAMANIYVEGFPSVTGILGMMHATQRKCNFEHNKNIKFNAVSVFLRELECSITHPRFTPGHENQRASGNSAIAATVDTRILNFVADFVFNIDLLDENLDENIDFLQSEDFKNIFFSNFCCSGVIESVDKIKFDESFFTHLNSIPYNAFVLECASDELIKIKNEHEVDALEALLRMCEGGKRDEKNVDFYAVPLAVGFVSLDEQPQQREGARAVQHIYAEPLLGAGRLRNVKSLRNHEKQENHKKIFWSYFSNSKMFIAKSNTILEI
ncbi:type I-F CRISPR-associated protein Csy2 [Spirobacillus cienkowskii]|uniref:type I-F CRISPR-associated protein Csy2 n=1 Tax=Spirobacillus cienkowskii TaxID=495820 RepID=UPI0030D43EEE